MENKKRVEVSRMFKNNSNNNYDSLLSNLNKLKKDIERQLETISANREALNKANKQLDIVLKFGYFILVCLVLFVLFLIKCLFQL